MVKAIPKSTLLKQMEAYFPDRWEVAKLDSRTEGRNVIGAIKIHCLEDDKVFLSDFSATLDKDGRIRELELDGVTVGKFVGRLHSAR